MRPTDDERRKVAARLRGLAREGALPSWPSLHEAVHGARGGWSRADTALRLADLVDPGEDHVTDASKEATTMSAYDLLPAEDREVLEWVRSRGGLGALRHRVDVALAREPVAIGVCSLLGMPDDSLAGDVMDEIRARLMPEGMEWPRFEDGEPVRIGDEVVTQDRDYTFEVSEIAWNRDYGLCIRYPDDRVLDVNGIVLDDGERVRRPAPKVLDADGVEIREKRDAWWICEGDERGVHAERLRVETICPSGLIECSPYNGGTWVYLEPSELYVNKPVPASDGKPLKAGDTVWGTATGSRYTVVRFERISPYVDVRLESGGVSAMRSQDLTHERPDSWERLEKDAVKNPFDYCKDVGHSLDTCEDSEAYKARDLVRRAKALAGVIE